MKKLIVGLMSMVLGVSMAFAQTPDEKDKDTGYFYFESHEHMTNLTKKYSCSDEPKLCEQLGVFTVLSFAASCVEHMSALENLSEEQKLKELDEIVELGKQWKVFNKKELIENFYYQSYVIDGMIEHQLEFLSRMKSEDAKEFCKFKEILINQEDPKKYSGLKQK